MRIVLQPTGTVTGRLVDEDGKPRAGADLVRQLPASCSGATR